MKRFAIVAALLLSSSASAATYVYQANAYQGHSGRCGKELLPFQATISVKEALPPNSTVNVPLKSISINAGVALQWSKRYNKKRTDYGGFTTDPNGNITEWLVGGGTSRGRAFWSQNETGDVQDMVEFNCGSAGTAGSPGVWTRTE